MTTDGLVITALLAAVALAANKTVSVIKALWNRDANGFVTPMIVWLVSLLAVVLLCHAKLTAGGNIPVLGVTFGSLDGASQLLFAWILGGPATFSFDIRKAIDNTDTAAERPLLPGPPGQPPTG